MQIRNDIKDLYSIRHCEQMNAFREGLWAHPEWITELPADTAREVITYLLENACKATNDAPILLGRRALYVMPRPWITEQIEEVAEKVVDKQESFQYRRLLELYCCLDEKLAWQLVSYGLASSDPDIKEAAQDYMENPERFKSIVCKYLNSPLP